jgi:Family of unknown function (DUF6188)
MSTKYMYGLDKNVKLDFLISKELIQLRIGLYQFMLHFEEDTNIMIEATSKLTTSNKKTSTISANKPDEAIQLVCLLGKKVVKVINFGDGNIEIIFSTGDRLTILDSHKTFESYKIHTLGIKDIIV